MFPQTPIGEGTKRSLITGAGTFIWTAFSTYQGFLLCNPLIGEACAAISEGDKLKTALVAGVIAAFAPFGTQMLQAAGDQRRADKGQIQASDVPVAAVAHKRRVKPETALADFGPPNDR